ITGERVHPGLGLGSERVEPVKPRQPPEFEVDDRWESKHLRGQRPAARAVEAPREQPLPGLGGPIRERGCERLPAVAGISYPDLLALEIAAVEHIDAEAEETLAARGYQPRHPVFLGERPAGGGRGRKIAAGDRAAGG